MSYNHFLKVYIANITPLMDEENFVRIYNDMPDGRKEKINRIKSVKGKRESLGAGWLIKTALDDARCGDLINTIVTDDNGKPFFRDRDDLYFNLSHSGNMVMCAISSEPVGCDIQKMDRKCENIAKRCFSEEEQEYIFGPGEKTGEIGDDIAERFFRIWAMKEAYTKLTGDGICKDFRSFNVLELEESFLEYRVDDYCMSVCTEEDFGDVVLEWYEIPV